jgi:hypothetical protein
VQQLPILPRLYSGEKIKKKRQNLDLELVPTVDILRTFQEGAGALTGHARDWLCRGDHPDLSKNAIKKIAEKAWT